jgi:hypothetical protein
VIFGKTLDLLNGAREFVDRSEFVIIVELFEKEVNRVPFLILFRERTLQKHYGLLLYKQVLIAEGNQTGGLPG